MKRIGKKLKKRKATIIAVLLTLGLSWILPQVSEGKAEAAVENKSSVNLGIDEEKKQFVMTATQRLGVTETSEISEPVKLTLSFNGYEPKDVKSFEEKLKIMNQKDQEYPIGKGISKKVAGPESIEVTLEKIFLESIVYSKEQAIKFALTDDLTNRVSEAENISVQIDNSLTKEQSRATTNIPQVQEEPQKRIIGPMPHAADLGDMHWFADRYGTGTNTAVPKALVVTEDGDIDTDWPESDVVLPTVRDKMATLSTSAGKGANVMINYVKVSYDGGKTFVKPELEGFFQMAYLWRKVGDTPPIVIVENVGMFEGKEVIAKMTYPKLPLVDTDLYIYATNASEVLKVGSSQGKGSPDYKMRFDFFTRNQTVEDNPNNPEKWKMDSLPADAKLLLPVKFPRLGIQYPPGSNPLTQDTLQLEVGDQSDSMFQGLITSFNYTDYYGQTPTKKDFYIRTFPTDPNGYQVDLRHYSGKPSDGKKEAQFNLIYQGSSIEFSKGRNETDHVEFYFFNRDARIFIERGVPAPNVNEITDRTGFGVLSTITQTLPVQPVSNLYKDVAINFTVNGLERALERDDIKLMDEDGVEVSATRAEVTFTYKGNNNYEVKLTDKFIKKIVKASGDKDYNFVIGFNKRNIKMTTASEAEMMNYFNHTTKRFELPFTEVYNIASPGSESKVGLEEIKSESSNGVSPIQVNPPTGKAKVGMTISKGKEVTDIVASDFVTNIALGTPLAFDSVDAVIEDDPSLDFETLGPKSFNVILKSHKTGVESKPIKVNVTVVYNPIEFVGVTKEIKMKRTNNVVSGEGEVYYSGSESTRIKVETAPIFELYSEETAEPVTLRVYKKGDKALGADGVLTILSDTDFLDVFSVKAPQDKFEKVDIYKGSMNFVFTVQ
ncbi:hypothetical protein [Enterococcus wangshanyuanii]|uniref:MucBP domain-containing protein n=1 Tax=Enterococcus wangshanyuanii TaxID=2005703 RepID=A0ABQ1PPU5_9ENTE|nr:hypothetical protein [Enterococcus wangshanyuanii]GGD00657.1 hypothetical protein GCM10011573_32800 [Enterococcus wangshanyuanii]